MSGRAETAARVPPSLVATILIGQALYSAGDALASGLLLAYFLDSLSASTLSITLLLVLPEFVALGGLAAQSLVRRAGSARTVWWQMALLSRAAGLAAAGAGVLLAGRPLAVALTLGLLVVAELAQAISYAALIAWLTSLIPRSRWGRVLAVRGGTIAAMKAVATVLSGFAVLRWLGDPAGPGEYAAVIGIGQVLTLAGVLVYARLPASERPLLENESEPSHTSERSIVPLLRRLLQSQPTRRTLLTALHLAAAQGLTQGVFYVYWRDHLELSAGLRQSLVGLMFTLQIPVALATGVLLDRLSNRRVYAASLALVALAVPCWLLARGHWAWTVAAYAVWGLFGAVNLAGRNLMLRLVERDEAAGAVAAFRFLAGGLAAATGLLGGWLLTTTASDDGSSLIACQVLLLISLAGRITAPLWLLGWHDERE